jgi:hypothetical protein
VRPWYCTEGRLRVPFVTRLCAGSRTDGARRELSGGLRVPRGRGGAMVLVNHALYSQVQDVLVLLLEIFVGLASFTGCLVAVDKLYLFYSLLLYKGLALCSPLTWEPTLRYPRRWKRGVKPPKVCVQLPMFNETFVARRIIDYSCRMEYPSESFYVQVLDDSTDSVTRDVVDEGIRYCCALTHAILHRDPHRAQPGRPHRSGASH